MAGAVGGVLVGAVFASADPRVPDVYVTPDDPADWCGQGEEPRLDGWTVATDDRDRVTGVEWHYICESSNGTAPEGSR